MRRPDPAATLLPLAFGQHSKQRVASLDVLATGLIDAGYRLHDLGYSRSHGGLAVDIAYVGLPSASLMAVAATPHRAVTERHGRVCLCFAVAGGGMLSADGVTLGYHQGAGALIPASPVAWEIHSPDSNFEVSLDRQRLIDTARAMLGIEGDDPLPGLDLDRLQPVSPRVGVVDGLATLRTLAIQAETYRAVPRVLAVSGIDDQCHRIAALLLMPEAFQLLRVTPASLRVKHTRLDRLCDWMRAHLHLPLTLTDLERQSGVTGRMLQIAFQKRYGTSPMAWLREQRLQAAKTMLDQLSDTGELAALAAIAAACGFGSVKSLRRCYGERFGGSIGPFTSGRS